jgi:hypothetical protein
LLIFSPLADLGDDFCDSDDEDGECVDHDRTGIPIVQIDPQPAPNAGHPEPMYFKQLFGLALSLSAASWFFYFSLLRRD